MFSFALQGKQVSQMIAYIWLWIDKDNDPNEDNKRKAEIAKMLREYFVNPNSGNADFIKATSLEDIKKTFAERPYEKVNNKLIKLFGADPRGCLNGCCDCSTEAKLLIEVFGEKRVLDPDKYLSPMFTPSELGTEPGKEDAPHYEFRLDPSTFAGYLRDPDLQRPTAFQYYLAFPPRPQIGVNLTEDHLEEWIRDDNNRVIFPNNVYIPVSTS